MDLWNTETPIAQIKGLDIDIPHWIEQDISPNDVAAIMQGGCASGAYMPAVTYHNALMVMAEHGDDVLQYIEDAGIGFEFGPIEDQSWSGIACKCLSTAVELWALRVNDTLEAFEPETADA